MYLETPSSLEVEANLWSDYKHHCISKFLVAVTPNGAISWVSSTYGGRTSDVYIYIYIYIYIYRNSGFLELLEPYDTVMADGGFKIKSDLTMKIYYLAIPASAAKGAQMTKDDVSETNRVANVCIFVEKAIPRLKWFLILKIEIPLLEMPLLDDIVIVCSALCNLLPPLCQ